MQHIQSSRKNTVELRHKQATSRKVRNRVKDVINIEHKFALMRQRISTETDAKSSISLKKSQLGLPNIRTPKNVSITEPTQQTQQYKIFRMQPNHSLEMQFVTDRQRSPKVAPVSRYETYKYKCMKQQNARLVDRLIQMKPTIKASQFKESYRQHEKFMKNIEKYKLSFKRKSLMDVKYLQQRLQSNAESSSSKRPLLSTLMKSFQLSKSTRQNG